MPRRVFKEESLPRRHRFLPNPVTNPGRGYSARRHGRDVGARPGVGICKPPGAGPNKTPGGASVAHPPAVGAVNKAPSSSGMLCTLEQGIPLGLIPGAQGKLAALIIRKRRHFDLLVGRGVRENELANGADGARILRHGAREFVLRRPPA